MVIKIHKECLWFHCFLMDLCCDDFHPILQQAATPYAEHHYAEHHYPEWSQISSLCWVSSCWMLWNCIQHCSITYQHKMPGSVGPSIMSICCFQGGSCVKTDCRDQCYKTFYSRNLCWARVFVPGKPSQLSLIFVSKARAYPSEVTFRCSTLG